MKANFIPALNININTRCGHGFHFFFRPSNVTAKAVGAIIDGFCAPDITSVRVSYNMYQDNSGIYFNNGFDRKVFLKWWKRAKLGD